MKHRRLLALILPMIAISILVTAVVAWIQYVPPRESQPSEAIVLGSKKLPPVVVPDRGEPRTDRLAALDRIVSTMRDDSSTLPGQLADALLSKAEVLGELDRHAAAGATVVEVLGLVSNPLTWQHRDAKILQAALLRKESTFGEEQHQFKAAMLARQQAVSSYGRGEYRVAIQAARRAVTTRRHLQSSELFDLAQLGDDLLLLGQLCLEHAETYLGAKDILEEARGLVSETRGESNPRYANVLVALASIADDQGDFQAADAMYERALTIHRETRGELSLPFAARSPGKARCT